jgi:hypothetical protein
MERAARRGGQGRKRRQRCREKATTQWSDTVEYLCADYRIGYSVEREMGGCMYRETYDTNGVLREFTKM